MRVLPWLFAISLVIGPASTSLISQKYLEQQAAGVNFYTIRDTWHREHPSPNATSAPTVLSHTAQGVDTDEDESPEEREGEDFLYARWENFWQSRVHDDGSFPTSQELWQSWQNQQKRNQSQARKGRNSIQSATQWKFLGPTTAVPTGRDAGVGRVACVRFVPGSSDSIFVGTPGGGLWLSPNGGTTWIAKTDSFPSLGVADIAVNPKNHKEIYLATGDMDGGNSMSFGVIKSTDGGNTWFQLSLSYLVSQTAQMSRIVINPVNPSIVICATSAGVYYSSNSGDSWSRVLSGKARDLEFKPGDPTVVYASVGSTVYRSLNGGQVFVKSSLPAGTPSPERVALGVSPANPNYVYALAANTSHGFGALCRSTNAGSSWTIQSIGTTTTKNILNWASDGAYDANATSQGQGWYDLSIAVSPDDPNLILVGGVNIWKSTDGGVNWTISAHWQGTNAPFVHADCHDLNFMPNTGGEVFAGTDGGIFLSEQSGSDWTNISAGLGILQFYRIGTNPMNPTIVIGGCQDNGTNLCTNGKWKYVNNADGMEAFFEPDGQTAYSTIYYGALYRSDNGGQSFRTYVSPLGSNTGPWITAYYQKPLAPGTIYSGTRLGVYVTQNHGDTWTSMSGTAQANAVAFAASAADPSTLYVTTGSNIYKTTNNGTDWLNVTGTVKAGFISNLAADPSTAGVVAATISGYDTLRRVYLTTDAGANWTNITKEGLPNAPVNCAAFFNTGCLHMLIVGTDIGCYFTTDQSNAWESLNNGLPNAIINDLDIVQNTLHVGTFGRALWELQLPGTKPSADFSSSTPEICPGHYVRFTNESAGGNAILHWEFPGGTPSSSELTSPLIRYDSSGTFDVRFRVLNDCASDSLTRSAFVHVFDTQKPTITRVDNTLGVNDGVQFQWYRNGLAVSGATSSTYTADTIGVYQVMTISTNGCSTLSDSLIVGALPVTWADETTTLSVYPNPTTDVLHIRWNRPVAKALTVRILDDRGALVYEQFPSGPCALWQTEIGLRTLAASSYVLELTVDGAVYRRSFVKE